MIEVTNLYQLVELNYLQKNKIQKGTLFKYKGNVYQVKRFGDVLKICRENCEVLDDFNNDLNKEKINKLCKDVCPFEFNTGAVKVSEIEALILLEGEKNEYEKNDRRS